DDGIVRVGRIAIAVTALVERVHVEVWLERGAERVPGMGMPGEAMEEQERRAPVTAPVEQVKSQPVDDQRLVHRAQEVHVAQDSRIGPNQRRLAPRRSTRSGRWP